MSKLPTVLGPLFLAIIYGLLIYLFRGYISIDAFLSGITALYATYGYMLVFFAAFAEASFPIGLYVPGSTAVLLGAALSRNGTLQFPLVYIAGTTGLLCGYILNYFLGKYGWYHVLTIFKLEKGISQGKEKLERYGRKAIFVGYVWPGSAAFLSTAAGVLRMPFGSFLLTSLLSQAIWSFLWGGMAYVFGITLVEFLLKYAFLFVLCGVVIVLGKRLLKR